LASFAGRRKEEIVCTMSRGVLDKNRYNRGEGGGEYILRK